MYKIVHLTSVHSSFDTRIFHKECKTLTQLGYEVVLVVQHEKHEKIDEIQIRALPKPKNRIERIIHTSWQVYRLAIQENAQIYHFHDPELIPIGLLLKAQGKKVIYDVHEDVPRQIMNKPYIAKCLRGLISWITEKGENFASRHFNVIITATPYIKKRFSKLGCYVIDINNYPILDELHLPNVNWCNKEKVICYIGGISEKRGIGEMVEAIGQIDAKLLLAGNFLNMSYRKQVMSMDGWVNVQELGHLDRQQVAQALARSVAGLVLLHPIINYIDALPVKMFEYMSAKIPVIASNFPLWIEIVEGNQCGICVDPLNTQALTEAIKWIFNHPEQAKIMGENGRKAIEQKYNWQIESEKLIKIYKELLL